MMNIEKFKTMAFEGRTAAVKVPSMSAFFEEGKPAEITVRGLTGVEVAKARQRVSQNAAVGELVDKLLSEKAGVKVQGLKESLGISDDVPDDTVYRIAVLEAGLVDFEVDQEQCVRMNDAYPEAFYSLTSKILELTGLGKIPMGESNASGMTTG